MKSPLTILLTLKGRHPYTLRWLWHANRIALPFNVFVADGEVHPTIARLLSDPSTFPNLSFEYHQYDDRSFSDFYRKCDDALSRIRTPYVKYSDNDDFVFPTGLAKCVDFLERSPDYVCAGGGIPGFSVSSRNRDMDGLAGSIDHIRYRYSDAYRSRDIDAPAARDRVLEEIRNYIPVYYHVHRTPAMRAIAADLLRNDFTILQLHEMYGALRAMSLGKARTDATVLSEFRQYGTSIKAQYHADWVRHLVFNRRTGEEIALLGATIANVLTANDEASAETMSRDILVAYEDRLRRQLGQRLRRAGKAARLAPLRAFARNIVDGRYLPRPVRGRFFREAMLRRLAFEGAPGKTVAAHRGELRQIEATLAGREFSEFMRRHAPDLWHSAASGTAAAGGKA